MKDYKKRIKDNLIEIYIFGVIWFISLFLSSLAIDLKLETFGNVSISTFICSSFWLLVDFIIICIYTYKLKKQKKAGEINEKK